MPFLTTLTPPALNRFLTLNVHSPSIAHSSHLPPSLLPGCASRTPTRALVASISPPEPHSGQVEEGSVGSQALWMVHVCRIESAAGLASPSPASCPIVQSPDLPCCGPIHPWSVARPPPGNLGGSSRLPKAKTPPATDTPDCDLLVSTALFNFCATPGHPQPSTCLANCPARPAPKAGPAQPTQACPPGDGPWRSRPEKCDKGCYEGRRPLVWRQGCRSPCQPLG